MRWIAKCSNCGARNRSLDYYAPMTRQAFTLCRQQALAQGLILWHQHGIRLCTACTIELT